MTNSPSNIKDRIITLLKSNKFCLDDLHQNLETEGFGPVERYPAISSLYKEGQIILGDLIPIGKNCNAFARQIIVTEKIKE